MEIHSLNSKTPSATDVLALDTGSDTYKATGTAVVENAAPTYTSGDAASPTSWADVTVLSSGLSVKTLLNRISTMIKNVRWLYSKLGTTELGTTATTITGAIAEHEADISGLNSNKLGFLGDFTGNMNSVDISPGIYRLNAAGSYTITDLPGSMSDPAYCLFIQEPYFNTQVILNDSYLLIRKRTGNPPAWRSWLKLPS